MSPDRIPCIGGPLHGKTRPLYGATYVHRTTGSDGVTEHRYRIKKYANENRSAFFWVHPDATDAQIDHALGLADI